MVDSRIKRITSRPPSLTNEVTKINESLLKASLDHTLTVSDKILTIISDEQLQQAVLDVSKLTKSMTEESKPQKRPETSNEWVAFLQNPQPDPSRPLRVMMAEYDHRIGQNLTHLSPHGRCKEMQKTCLS